MPVGSHTDERDVKGGPAHQSRPRLRENRRRLVERTFPGSSSVAGRHTHELDPGGRVEESLPRLVVVTVLVSRGHVALVNHPHAHARPIDLADAGEQ